MNEQQDISDYRLQAYYKRLLKRYGQTQFLKSQYRCGVSVIKPPGLVPGVFVLQRGKEDREAKIWGVTGCKSPWTCPHCAPRKMARYATDIACAIEALKKQNKVGIMITFSVPHSIKFNCKQALDMLQITWRHFHEAGIKETHKNRKDFFIRFNKATNCEHVIKLCEFTWGYNAGWHPHYHCIFFIDKSRLNRIKDFEAEMVDRWHSCAKRAILQIVKRDHIVDNPEDWLKRFYERLVNGLNSGAFVSKDRNGKPSIATSSMYLCGWETTVTRKLAREVTSLEYKTAAIEHYTPRQILIQAYKYHLEKDTEREAKFAKLYVELAITTNGKYRMKNSPKIKAIVDAWKKTQDYITIFKKKFMDAKEKGKWQAIFYFNKQLWSDICLINKHNDGQLMEEIMQKARLPNATIEIYKLLADYGIDASRTLEGILKHGIASAKNVENAFNRIEVTYDQQVA